jgi:hypothetical protein
VIGAVEATTDQVLATLEDVDPAATKQAYHCIARLLIDKRPTQGK